jgi:F-type H+-transporting ATPase subunit d
MAARRVAKTAVDWAAFAERVPPNQKEAYRAFKSKSDLFISKVHRFPENLPTIDFANYTSRLTNKAIVADFEKQYKSLSIAFPKDKSNLKAQIDADEKQAQVETQKRVAEMKQSIEESKAVLAKIDSIPGPGVMTPDMYFDYFPDIALNPWERPDFYPHTKSYQPKNDPHAIL